MYHSRVSTIPPAPPPQTFPPLPPQYPRPRTWVERNWKWFIPSLVIFALLVFAGFVGAVLFGVTHMIRNSIPYRVAVERAMKNPDVQAELGMPITVGRLTTGKINTNRSNGFARLAIPLRGPKGRGLIYVEAEMRFGAWSYRTLEFAPDAGDRIQLLDSTLPRIVPLPPADQSSDGST